MTGNIVFLGFAAVGTPELSIARSSIALVAFLVGALVGGRIMARTTPDSQLRTANSAFAIETVLLLAATVTAVNYSGIQSWQQALCFDCSHGACDGRQKCHGTQAGCTRSDHYCLNVDALRLGGRFLVCRWKQSTLATANWICRGHVCWRRLGRLVVKAFARSGTFPLRHNFVHLHSCSVSFFSQGFASTSLDGYLTELANQSNRCKENRLLSIIGNNERASYNGSTGASQASDIGLRAIIKSEILPRDVSRLPHVQGRA